jgi:vitamin B12 transporter
MMHVGARPDAGIRLAPETTLDLMAQWQVEPRWSVQFKALNVTQESIVPARDYQGLGRQAWVVLRYENQGR